MCVHLDSLMKFPYRKWFVRYNWSFSNNCFSTHSHRRNTYLANVKNSRRKPFRSKQRKTRRLGVLMVSKECSGWSSPRLESHSTNRLWWIMSLVSWWSCGFPRNLYKTSLFLHALPKCYPRKSYRLSTFCSTDLSQTTWAPNWEWQLPQRS